MDIYKQSNLWGYSNIIVLGIVILFSNNPCNNKFLIYEHTFKDKLCDSYVPLMLTNVLKNLDKDDFNLFSGRYKPISSLSEKDHLLRIR